MSAVLVWFRTDLRLDDHEPLTRALRSGAAVIPVYVVDPRAFGRSRVGGFARTGPHRARFLLESLADLRRGLRACGGDLVVRHGDPAAVLPELARTVEAGVVWHHEEACPEEVDVEDAVARVLAPAGARLEGCWGHTLYHPDDLPFDLDALPHVFTRFRRQVERDASVRPLLPGPARVPALPPGLDPGPLPTLADLGTAEPPDDPRATFAWRGGSAAARERLQAWMWTRDRLRRYKETRNGLLDPDDASRLSPWLALGCLSPRQVAAAVARYEHERGRNDSTAWLVVELLWRDHFRFLAAREGGRFFGPRGLQARAIPWRRDADRWAAWTAGRTGYPLVDAAMRELAATGFITNRARQNAASFLTKNLGLDWRLGAEWFESLLLDYDPASNWGNWLYVAGVGTDPRGFRLFDVEKQRRDYDPGERYVRHWLPDWGTPRYPRPVVDFHASAAATEAAWRRAGTAPGDAAVPRPR